METENKDKVFVVIETDYVDYEFRYRTVVAFCDKDKADSFASDHNEQYITLAKEDAKNEFSGFSWDEVSHNYNRRMLVKELQIIH